VQGGGPNIHDGDERAGAFLLAAGDLLLSADAYGTIIEASGDASFLHHPSSDRLLGLNFLNLLRGGEETRLREDLWALAPGRRLQWTDEDRYEGVTQILVQRVRGGAVAFRCLFTRTHHRRTLSPRSPESELSERFRRAVMDGGLSAARQPVVDTKSGRPAYFEVLARFESGESTADLIRAAERSGDIVHLDYIMLEAAASRLSEDPDRSLRLAVNMSGASLQREDVVAACCASLTGRNIEPGRLILEITESSPITETALARANINRLRSTGALISLDDFGAGSASFAYLNALDVDTLKIDGGLIRNPPDPPRALSLLRSMQTMCRELGLIAVGEQVETEAERTLLLSAGVPFAQGYLFGRPEPMTGFLRPGLRGSRAA